MIVYLGWRDLGPKRAGRVWKLHATQNPNELSVPPWRIIGRVA